MKLWEHERLAMARLKEAGCESPGLCARLLVGQAAGMDKIQCIINAHCELSHEKACHLRMLVERCAKGEPLAYILGRKEFYEMEFIIKPGVLVPRPETELLVELSLGMIPAQEIAFADAGCGCGCIGLSLLGQRPRWQGFLLDASQQALSLTRKNARNMGLDAQIIAADIFHLPFSSASLDLIVSNPPYIAPAEIGQIMHGVLQYEPHEALFSGCDGLEHIRSLARQATQALCDGGTLLLEHGATQREAVCRILGENGFIDCMVYDDLAGLPRCVMARKKY